MIDIQHKVFTQAILLLHELRDKEGMPTLTHLHKWLTADERSNAERYIHPTAYAHYVASRTLVRRGLAAILKVQPLSLVFDRTPRGRPFLVSPVAPSIDFNLAHSGNWVGLLIAPFPVGLDLEPLNRHADILDIAQTYFSPEEASWISSEPTLSPKRFFSLWTLKEAYLKGCGRGIDSSLAAIRFGAENNGWLRVSDETSQDGISWHGALLDCDANVCVAICQPATATNFPRVIRITGLFDDVSQFDSLSDSADYQQ
ncbi:MAG TPA: 4'-phosphopantetheinyl transferase superfamily protein [Burkholderiales bacterium]|jgi:4'-phosphopantetheinyl transferase|nr:4'-phosphopantetheinyl transferase superfamily protein [Burkholderiales bacterium]